MRNPLRFWMTGAIAVVVAALGNSAGAAARSEGEQRTTLRRLSPYGVAETVLRIEASARQHGLAVFAHVEQGVSAGGRSTDAFHVIVLEASQGGTPVLMLGTSQSEMEIPLSVTVRQAAEGQTEVLIASAEAWDAMPSDVAADLASLPGLVADALQG